MSRGHQGDKIKRSYVRDSQGQKIALMKMDDDLLDAHSRLPPEAAELIVANLRALGATLWLSPQPDGTVRCRMLTPFEPSDEMAAFLARHMRPIAKAVARVGADDPPPNNPYGDVPLPPGGRWSWDDDDDEGAGA